MIVFHKYLYVISAMFLINNIAMTKAQMTIIMSKGATTQEDSYCFRNEFPTDYIKEKWDAGARITNVAYGSGKWMVTCAKNTVIGMQTYSGRGEFPSQWIKQKWDENYRITDAAYGNSGWVVIMSQGLYDGPQSYYHNANWPKDWLKEQKSANKFITTLTYGNGEWFVTASSNCGITDQTWDVYDDKIPQEKVQEMIDKDYVISEIATYKNQFVIVYSKGPAYTNHSWLYNIQNWDNAQSWIKGNWNENFCITSLGGHLNNASPSTNNTTNNNHIALNRPSYGTYPAQADLYYKGETFAGHLTINQNNGFCTTSFISGSLVFVSIYAPKQTSDSFILDNMAGQNLIISKDWSSVKITGFGMQFVYNTQCTKEDFNQSEKLYQQINSGSLPQVAGGNNNMNINTNPSINDNNGSKKNTRRTCPGCNGTGKGMDQITYSPNYTGEDNSRWCSICGKNAPAHSHRQPMCRVCYGKGYVE
ncbi:MAG: zinc finger-like domain-containing protein [Bacteroidaceae bacterium]|nr:zinc finger-like domain-containing protein [Bacteroidaceae bacterium]